MGLWDDARGQSVQVGAVLLFAVLVILLAMYQSTVVPNQNKAAEFEHSLDARQDLLDARNAILRTFQTGASTPVTVRLGMTYPNHLFAVDPPPVAGTIRTTPGGTVSVTGQDGPVDVCPVSSETKLLNYSAGYNYLRPTPTLVYENTVLYADYGDDVVQISDQSLVVGSTINLIALRGNYSENGIAATDFAPKAGQFRTTPVDDPNISIPTRLSEGQWEDLLSGEVPDPADVSVVSTPDGRVLQLNLTGAYDVRCGLVGASSVPEGGPRRDAGGVDINPAGPGDVVVENPTYSSSDKTVTATFNNTGETNVTMTRARVAFYFSGNNQPPSALVLQHTGQSFPIGGSMKELTPSITIQNESTRQLTFSGSGKDIKKGDWFIVQIQFDTGNQGTYFIFVPQ
ncbi:MAG: hypothetical protein ABEJ67_01605 [Halanaeroarchaeum sp.]